MSKPRLLLIGAGGHARSCIEVIERGGEYVIGGLLGASGEVGRDVLGYKIIGTDEDLESFARQFDFALIAVGQIKTPRARLRIAEELTKAGVRSPLVISPAAVVSAHATIGAGTIVMHGAIVNAGAAVGAHCIINSRALVEHDAVIGDNCHISTGAIVNGGAKIGNATFVGSGSIVKEGASIGSRSVIAMGAHVVEDVPDGSTVKRAPR